MPAALVRDARPSVPCGAPHRPGLHGFKERRLVAQELVVGTLGAPFPKPLTASAEGPRIWEHQCQGWSPALFPPLQCRGLSGVTCPGLSHTPFPAQRWPRAILRASGFQTAQGNCSESIVPSFIHWSQAGEVLLDFSMGEACMQVLWAL